MKRSWKRGLEIAAVLVLALVLAGCVGNPIAPVLEPSSGTPAPASSDPPVLTVSTDGTADFTSAPTESTTDAQLLLIDLSIVQAVATELPTAILTSASVDGAKGGTLRCGRFRLDIPAGAFAGTATIQMAQPDSTMMLCDLSISPSSLNHFSKPVTLTLDASGLTVSAASLSIYWYDPLTRLWIDLRAKTNPATGQVTQQLTHFSRYIGGKAGW